MYELAQAITQPLMWLLQILGYGLVAGCAAWFARRTYMAVVGLTAVACWFLSTISYFGGSFWSLVTVEMAQAALLISQARIAHVARPSAPPRIVVLLCIADIAFCSSLFYGWLDPKWRGFIYGTVTNIIFLLVCACVVAPRVHDAVVGALRDLRASRRLGGARLSRNGRDGSGAA